MKTLGSARVVSIALLLPLVTSILAFFSSPATAQEVRGYDFCPDTNVYAYVPSPVSDPITSYDDPRLEPSNQLAQQQFEEQCPELMYLGFDRRINANDYRGEGDDREVFYAVHPYGKAIIEAIMGGGTVIGTECVDGKVTELVSEDAVAYGPEQTLYVKTSGKTRLRKYSEYSWINGDGPNNKDKVNFISLATGFAEGDAHYLSANTAGNEVAEFGTSAGGTANVITGQGTHQMQFVSQAGGKITLGTMYTAELVWVDGGSQDYWSCIPAGLMPPDQPENLEAEAHAGGGMLVSFDYDGAGDKPTYFTYEAKTNQAAGNRSGRVVDADGDDDTSSPFLIIGDPPFSDNPGDWQVRLKAWNAAGDSDWSAYSNYITPNAAEPPVPDAPEITGVTTDNGRAVIVFTAPAGNGSDIINYAFRLTPEFEDPDLPLVPFYPEVTSSPITLTDLNNGETYSFSIAATNENGTGPDSNEVQFTPGTQCQDVTDWTAPADALGYFCSVGLNDYAFADFHILTTIDTSPAVCSQNKLPTADNNGAGLFCQQNDTSVRALFDWGWASNSDSDGCSEAALVSTPIYEDCLHWLKSVSQFGSRAADAGETSGLTVSGRVPNQLTDGAYAFARFAGEGGNGFQILDTSNLTSLRNAFARAERFNEDISAWNTAKVENLNKVFWGSGFNKPIPTNGSAWDVSRVHNFAAAFGNSSFNQDLSSWDVGEATNFTNMFVNNRHFNQNLSAWGDKLTQLTTMENMFKAASAFNNGAASGASGQPLNWGAAPKLQKMNYTFANATSFNQQIFANGASTTSVENMSGTFKNAVAFNQNIGGWNTQSLQKTASMFEGASAFNQDIGSWSTDLVTNMNAMFKNAEAFNQDLSGWAIGKPGGDFADFDLGADAWCGLGFENQGRPIGFPATTQACQLDLDLTATPEDIVEAGNVVAFTMTYSNDSGTDVTNGTLAFTLPDGTNLNAEQTSPSYSQANNTLTWTVNVPAGSDGGERLVVVDVPTSFSGDTLSAEATLSAPSNTGTANKTASLRVGGDAVWEASLEAPEYVLAGEALTYEITLENTGNRDAQGVEITLSWDTDQVVPGSTAGNCTGTPMTCSWTASVKAGGQFETTLSAIVPADTPMPGVISAEMSVNEGGTLTPYAAALTEVDAQPDLAVTLRSLPKEMVGLNKNIAVEVIVQNTGTAAASEVNVRLPTSIAAFASSNSNGSASGDDVVWPQIDTLLPNQSSVVLTAQLTAPGTAGAIQTEASVTGKSPGGVELGWESELITVQVADQAAPQLTARFVPATFAPGEEISLVFDYENFGSVAMSDATLSIPIPKDTAVANAPTGGSCTETLCTVNTGEVAAGAKSSQSVTLTVSESVRPERLAGSGFLRAVTVGEFQPQAATAEAEQQDTTAMEPPYELEITPPAGSGCTLASVGLQSDAGIAGYTLLRDDLLHFSITDCEPEALVEIPVAITVQGDPFPEGAEPIKTDDNAITAAAIAGATVMGNTIRYTLKDNGPLDLDPDDGELRDPVSAAIAGGSGIYVPFIPVPIPYWVLGLLAGLMGWLGYRRLQAA